MQETDADGVEGAGALAGFEAGGVVGVDEELAQVEARAEGEGGQEAAALLGREGRVVVWGGEMGEDAGEFEVFGGQDGGAQGGRLLVPDPEAAHARVDLEMDLKGAAGSAGHGIEARDLLVRGDGGGDIVFSQKTVLVGNDRAEHEDGPVAAEFAKGGGLGEVGDGEEVCTRVHEGSGGLMQAMAIGIGLHDRHVAHVAGQGGADEAQVAFQCVEIDLGPATQGKAGV